MLYQLGPERTVEVEFWALDSDGDISQRQLNMFYFIDHGSKFKSWYLYTKFDEIGIEKFLLLLNVCSIGSMLLKILSKQLFLFFLKGERCYFEERHSI